LYYFSLVVDDRRFSAFMEKRFLLFYSKSSRQSVSPFFASLWLKIFALGFDQELQ